MYHKIISHRTLFWGRDSVVGIATRYGMDGSGFEPAWEQDILTSPHKPRQPLDPTQPLLGLLPGGKATGASR
jgi:hypothetical protein